MAGQAVFGLFEVRLGEGGLLRRFEESCRLTKLRAQICCVIAVTWLPIVLFGLLSEFAAGKREPLIYNAAVHVRLLVALPVFLILDHVFPRVCKRVLEQFSGQAFIREGSRERFERTLQSSQRLTDSMVPELLLAGLGVALGVATLLGVVPISGLRQRGAESAAQVWYALSDVPLFHFLLWRSLWRWLVWTRILMRLSRLDLALVPTHPDRCGGIAFLRLPSMDYCAMLLFAVSSVLCAEWETRFSPGASFDSFKPLLAMFAAVAAMVAFGPLLFFMPLLSKVRRDGVLELGALAAHAGRKFQARWLSDRDTSRDLNLDVQGLAAMDQTFAGTADQIRLLLFDKRDTILLFASALAPVVPVMLAHVARSDWMKLAAVVTGGFIR
jgi:hypothetical protein